MCENISFKILVTSYISVNMSHYLLFSNVLIISKESLFFTSVHKIVIKKFLCIICFINTLGSITPTNKSIPFKNTSNVWRHGNAIKCVFYCIYIGVCVCIYIHVCMHIHTCGHTHIYAYALTINWYELNSTVFMLSHLFCKEGKLWTIAL